jgi:C4-dicarboxylate-specific signal transduction histidine kinase
MLFPTLAHKIAPLVICGFLIGGIAVVRADDAMERQAQSELEQAKSSTGLDQTSHLKNALEILQHLPAGASRHARGTAEKDIKSAIFEAQQGDPDNSVDEDIHNAEDAIDHIAR